MIAPDGKQIEMTVIQRAPYLLNPKSLDISAMPAINEAQIGPAIGDTPSRKRTRGDKGQELVSAGTKAEACVPVVPGTATLKAGITSTPGLLPDNKYKASYNPHHDSNSIEHLMTHRIKLRHCRVCQESKLMYSQHRQADNKAIHDASKPNHKLVAITDGDAADTDLFGPPPPEWGDQITLDHAFPTLDPEEYKLGKFYGIDCAVIMKY